MFGSKTVIGGELVRNCWGGVNNVVGLTEGAGSWRGKPPATVLLMLAELTHPAVIVVNAEAVVLYDVVQLWTSPGILPAAAVTWNDEIVSKAMPYPSRITLLLPLPNKVRKKPDLNSGLQARPKRGPIAPLKLPSYQCLALTKLTAPGWLTVGLAGSAVLTIGVAAT